MRTKEIKLCEITTSVLFIGFEGEQNYRRFVIDASEVFADMPDAVPGLAIKPPIGDVYPKDVSRVGNRVIWEVSAADCANKGDGEYQLSFSNGNEIGKVFKGQFRVFDSLIGSGSAPDPISDFVENANAVLGELRDMSASASSLPAGSEPTAELTEVGGHKNLAFGIPAGEQGEPGEPGEPGQDGVSPVVSVTDITGGHRVTIVDATGTKTFDVMDGEPGDPGQPGVSPSVTVTEITNGHRVAITDASGTETFDVMNGAKGDPGEKGDPGTPADPTVLIDDSSTALDKVWSAHKSAEENSSVMSAIDKLTPDATASDVGKAIIVKTVADGKPSSYEYGEAGGGDAVIDDTAGAGDTDKCWSADKTITEIQQIIVSGGVPIDDTAGQGDIDKLWSADKIARKFDKVEIEAPGKNLYDKSSCNHQDGKVYKANLSGLQDNSSYAVTGKMPVDGNTEYIFSAGGANVKYVVYFSGVSGETPISEVQIAGSSFTTPANCTYVDFELFAVSHTTEQYNAAINAGQLERGSTATAYEPYGSTSIFSIPAETTDEGKALSPKTVSNGRVTEWQYVDAEGTTITVDSALSDSSTNPVQNKVITGVIESVTDKNVSPNLYDKDSCNPQDGKVYNNSHVYTSSSSYAVTGKIPVQASTKYIFWAGEGVNIKYVTQWSGEQGATFVSETTINSESFTTGSSTTFVDFELFAKAHTTEEYNAAIACAMLVEGETVPETYQPYGQVTYVVPTDALEDGEAVEGAKNYTVKRSLINLYDKSLAVDNKVFNTNKLVDNTAYAFSGLIPVEPNAQYCYSIQKGLEYGYISAWYQRWDSSKAFIDEVQGNQSTNFLNQIHTTANTAYVSFCIYFGDSHTTEAFNTAIDTLMVVEGCQQPAEYVPYNLEPVMNRLKMDTMYRDNADRFKGKKWLVTGTSVSYQDSKYYTEGVAEGEVVRGYIGNIARRKPMLITNVAVSGSTLAGSDTNALINRYQNLNMGSYDFITIEYGINDFGNNVPVGTASDAAGTESFAACLKTIIEYALNQNPIVGLIICTDPDVRGTNVNQNGNTLKDYADVMLEIAAQYRLPVCDWFYHSGINSITKGDGSSRYFLTQSGTHPSVYGHMRMAGMLNQVFDSMLC